MIVSALSKKLSLGWGVFLLFQFLFSSPGNAQSLTGILKGRVVDALTNKTLVSVVVSVGDTGGTKAISYPDGNYLLRLPAGKYALSYQLEGFQSKYISGVDVVAGAVTSLDVVLSPMTEQQSSKFTRSLAKDSVIRVSFADELKSNGPSAARYLGGISDELGGEQIQPGTDKDGAAVLKRLGNVIARSSRPTYDNLQSLHVAGFGQRYNQIIFNGAVFNGFDPVVGAFPFSALPAEAIEHASVMVRGNPSVPGDFTGGTVSLATKDIPDRDFIYILAGTGFGSETRGKDFYGDNRNSFEWLGFPGAIRNLPENFPTSRSQTFLVDRNPQEQVFFSRKLTNNLEPINYRGAEPDDKVMFGFGRTRTYKKGQKLGVVAYITHQKSQRIDESQVQVAPDIAQNPFPFDASKILIRSFSNDVNYSYSSQLTAIINAALVFGRNKISLKNFIGSQFTNTLVRRSQLFKPDEDTFARSGINYATSQRKFWNVSLSGLHALGENGKFKIDWTAAYTYFRELDPDERNFLLRQDSTNSSRFEIAQQSAASLSSGDAKFTNSGRLWRTYTDHNFSGALNISVPFSLINWQQQISGGVLVQTTYREFHSDLLLTRGTGYYTLDQLLAPDRYYPGGLSVENYFVRLTPANQGNVFGTNRANYTAGANIGSAYVMLETRFSDNISLNGGVRMESNSYLVTSTDYRYFSGFRNPRILPIDENNRVTSFNILPSVTVNYQPWKALRAHGAYFKTVNRPRPEELTGYRYYDAVSFMVRAGNPLLLNSEIDNFDIGFEWLAKGGSSVAVSGIYKRIFQPIEYIASGYNGSAGNRLMVPHNTPPGDVRGVTASIRLNGSTIGDAPWLGHVYLFGHGTWTNSSVSGGPLKSISTPTVAPHQLSGTPEYMVNAGLVIQYPKYPMLTVLYNRIDDYLIALGSGTNYSVGNGKFIASVPDYWMKGREELDVQLSQKFFNGNLQIVIGANNLTASDYIEYQDLNGNKEFDNALLLTASTNGGVNYAGGTDNTVLKLASQRTYYLTLSFLFR